MAAGDERRLRDRCVEMEKSATRAQERQGEKSAVSLETRGDTERHKETRRDTGRERKGLLLWLPTPPPSKIASSKPTSL